jgi:proteasome assembly chaperone (PAC2) family protein
MAENLKLEKPWLIAVWPGMGQVAIGAGYYLMAKLGCHVLAEFPSEGLFEIEYIDVRGGLIRPGSLPRNRLFVWKDPKQQRDIVIFIGEAQPPVGKYALCRELIGFASRLGVERIFTFAAMATDMRPGDPSRVFAAAVDRQSLAELQSLPVEILEDGRIGGLNGVLLGIAAEKGMRGACLLGETPQLFVRLPYPKASLAVLELFSQFAEIHVDTGELEREADVVDRELGKLLSNVERAIAEQTHETQDEPEAWQVAPDDDDRLSPTDEQRIEHLFQTAQQDRSKAYELKRELDRLEVFSDYEDRFLDLFTRPE